MRALNVMDSAPCQVAVDVYATALDGEGTAEGEHGKRGLARCQPQAVAVLTQKLNKAGSERARPRRHTDSNRPCRGTGCDGSVTGWGLESQAPRLEVGAGACRSSATSTRARRGALANPSLTPRRGLFLLRGLGDSVTQVQDIATARLRAWVNNAAFDEHYLALEPISRLASVDAGLGALLQKTACCAEEPALRAEAARLLAADAAWHPSLDRGDRRSTRTGPRSSGGQRR